MVDVRAEEESLVQRLRLGENEKGEEGMQKKLDNIFKKSSSEGAVVAANWVQHSLPSLFMTNTTLRLEENLSDSIKKGYKDDSRWAEILDQLNSAQAKAVPIGNRDNRINHGFLEIKLKENDED